MSITAEDFRALARSAPWRFVSVHFTWRQSASEAIEAYLERPDRLRHRRGAGPWETVAPGQQTMSVMTFFADEVPTPEGMPQRYQESPGFSTEQVSQPWAADEEPVRRADGLVLARSDPWSTADDPMVDNSSGWPPWTRVSCPQVSI